VSDVVTTIPPPPGPPPPPPPPPLRPTGPAFDFVRPFTYTFEDPRWVQKVLMGGLFTLASVFLVGAPFVYGYLAQLVRNVIAGMERPLPEWDDLGGYFNEGLRLFGVAFVYALPMLALMGVFFTVAIVPSLIGQATDNNALQNLGGGMASCVWCLIVPISLAMGIWLPAAMLFAVVEQRFGAAFEFAQIAVFIRANAGNYLLAFVVWLVVRMVVPFGLILLCVGIVFTMFWSFLVAAHAFGQTWRLARR
jgi:hypothetical protein